MQPVSYNYILLSPVVLSFVLMRAISCAMLRSQISPLILTNVQSFCCRLGFIAQKRET